jgi:hypothetical protein
VITRFLRQVITQHSAPHRATGIDYQYPALPRGIDPAGNQRVVFKTADGCYFSGKTIVSPETTKHRIRHVNEVGIGVAQVG